MKYSKIKRHLKLRQGAHFEEGCAALTHYWQNHSDTGSTSFKPDAQRYFDTLEEPEFNYELPFEYDVPFPPVNTPDFTFIDLFAGIGGFRIAFQGANGKCVFSSEWDKYSQITYEANFGEVPFGDITRINEKKIPDHDILLGGFPCQPFSLAGVSKKNSLGKSHGFDDETQGTLFFDIKRILEEKKPKAFLLENVKNLKSHDKGQTYQVIKETLKDLDYSVFEEVIDAKHYVPQHRERIFIAGFHKNHFPQSINFKFPGAPESDQQVRSILDVEVNPKYTLSDKLWTYLQNYARKHKAAGNGFGFGLIDPNKVTRTLSARYHKDGSEILIPQDGKNPRRLTPEECKRLMGYPADYLINGIGISDTQLYRQFGNSVAVPVVQAIAQSMIEFMSCHSKENMETQRKERQELLEGKNVIEQAD